MSQVSLRCALRFAAPLSALALAAGAAELCGQGHGPLQATQRADLNAALARGVRESPRLPALRREAAPSSGGSAFLPLRFVVSDDDLRTDGRFCLDGRHRHVPDFSGAPGATIRCATGGADDLTAPRRERLRRVLLPAALAEIARLLPAHRLRGDLPPTPRCGRLMVPARHQAAPGPGAGDFALYVAAAPVPPSVFAYAAMCNIFSDTLRPYAGWLNVSPRLLDPPGGQAGGGGAAGPDPVRVLVHELLHTLGFHEWLLTRHPGATLTRQVPWVRGNRNGSLFLVGPAAAREARAFYGCAGTPGIELENEGGPGTANSHVERRVARDDLMAGVAGAMRVTPLSLAPFEDFSWHKPNYAAASGGSGRPPALGPAGEGTAGSGAGGGGGGRVFGAGEGCGFLEARCDTVEGGRDGPFCFDPAATPPRCAADYGSSRRCAPPVRHSSPLPGAFRRFRDPRLGGERLMDGCPVPAAPPPLERCGEPPAPPGSSCFLTVGFPAAPGGGRDWAAVRPRCLEARCAPGAAVVEVAVGGGRWAPCRSQQDVVVAGGGWVLCPDAVDFCRWRRQ